MAEPILKWAGGKRQVIDELLERVPDSYNAYHEPFLGGGALFFELEPTAGSINDTNTRLINFYRTVRDRPYELIERCKQFDDPESDPDESRRFATENRKGKEIKNYYYQQRELFNNRPNNDDFDPLEEAALLLYLNRTCFNGLFRENQSGEFNVPIGRYANPDWVRESEILTASPVLENINIYSKDFEYILETAHEDDFVYFDPPYKPMSTTAYFTDYSADGFEKDDQKRLLNIANKLKQNNTQIMLSNSGVMYEMYTQEGFTVQRIDAVRSINSDGENRGSVEEILVIN
jgi:DNA adenine methylase